MAEAKKDAALSILVHPLVVLSIADHITRDKVQTKVGRVIGVLFGKQNGRDVDILETTELSFQTNKETSEVKLDMGNFDNDYKLFIEAYPGYELLGWYSQGSEPHKNDKAIHNVLKEYNDRPLYMMVDDNVEENARDLPIKMFEERVNVLDDGNVEVTFCPTPYEIRSDEAERITVVHCARADGQDEGSSVRSHYATLSQAVGMLNERIKVIHQYLSDVESKKRPLNHGILRDIKGLTGLLPTMDSPEFSEDFLNEYNDALLLTYLSSVTKGCNVVTDIVDKFNITYSRPGGSEGRGRGRGGMGGIGGGNLISGMLGSSILGM